jgi:hypothetical protein
MANSRPARSLHIDAPISAPILSFGSHWVDQGAFRRSGTPVDCPLPGMFYRRGKGT